MARIRSLKPEFWDDRKLARSTSRDARMLYMGLWNQADEHGRLNGDELWIKGRVFPFEEDISAEAVTVLLAELQRAGRIVRYDHDGDPFIFLPKLGKHQRLEPSKVESRLPQPPEDPDSHTDPDSSEPRADQSAPDAKSSTLLYVPGSMDQGAGSREPVVPRAEKRAQGKRLPDDWQPTVDDIAWAHAHGVADADGRRWTERFRNYWHAKAGKDAVKLDWSKTWRNWIDTEAERTPTASAGGVRSRAQQETDDLFDRAAARLGVTK